LFLLSTEKHATDRRVPMKMKWNLLWHLLAFATAAQETCGTKDPGDAPPVIYTTSGRINGKVDPCIPNAHQYLGIPYAVPPLGERRWTAPELLNQPGWDIQATSLPPSCLQYWDAHTPSISNQDVLEYNLQGLNTTGAISEDCLTLSVWAPAQQTPPEGVPVLIFIYGGGFGVGGQDVPYQIPAQWVDRTPDHIVVSFNYRLGIFGFPNAGGLPEQNLAMLDTRAVLEWCQTNIGSFGGDPTRMVLWGQSAGSMMADYYGFAYIEDPIVTGLIMDSGTAFTPFFTVNDTARSNFTFVANGVGCAGLEDDPEQQLSCMRNVDGDVINNFIANYSETGELPGLAFVPIEENSLIFSNYTQRASDGLQAKIVRRAKFTPSPPPH
jgi:cholinesterase